MRFPNFPGAELIAEGIQDLAHSRESVPACLVSIGAPRLRRAGLAIPEKTIPSPEHRLYELLLADNPEGAFSLYNSLLRRLVSFERAAECAG